MSKPKHHPKRQIAEFVGWLAVIASLILYLLASVNILPSDTSASQILNALACLGMVYVGLHQKAPQSVAVNVIWAILAMGAFVYMHLHH